jgi:magnesium-transporting ATPase (P-type)
MQGDRQGRMMALTHGMEICMKVRSKPEHLPYFSSLAAGILAALFNREELGHQIWFLAYFLAVVFACGYVGSVFTRGLHPRNARRKTIQILAINAITFAVALLLFIGWFVFI